MHTSRHYRQIYSPSAHVTPSPEMHPSFDKYMYIVNNVSSGRYICIHVCSFKTVDCAKRPRSMVQPGTLFVKVKLDAACPSRGRTTVGIGLRKTGCSWLSTHQTSITIHHSCGRVKYVQFFKSSSDKETIRSWKTWFSLSSLPLLTSKIHVLLSRGPARLIMLWCYSTTLCNLAPHIHFARGQFRPHPQQTVPTQQNVTWHPAKPHKKSKN